MAIEEGEKLGGLADLGLGGDVQVLSSLQGGVIEMMTWNAGLMLNHVTDFGILDFPFLYTDTAKVDAMLDGEVGKMLTDQLPEQKLVGLAFWELGVRNLTNNSPWLTRPELVEIVAGSAALAGREQRRVSNFTVRATLNRPAPAAPGAPAPAAAQPPGKV